MEAGALSGMISQGQRIEAVFWLRGAGRIRYRMSVRTRYALRADQITPALVRATHLQAVRQGVLSGRVA